MRAICYERTGPANDVLQLVDLPTPEPGPGEVRVRLAWSGVNPSDVKARAGLRRRELPFPRIIPHSDGSGVIDAVGEGVDAARIGEPVWVWNAAWQRPLGTAADYVTLPAEQVVRLPVGVDPAIGACMGIPALTAYHAVHVNGGIAGQTVLIAGGAGSVGQYAVQMARYAGATRIITTVSGPEKATLAERLGADVVINYKTESVAERIMDLTADRGVDRIIEVEFAGNVDTDLACVRADGEIVIYGSDDAEIAVPFFPAILKNVRMQFFIVYNLNSTNRQRALSGVTRLLETDALEHTIAARLPLERTAEAHQLVEQGKTIGNVLIEIVGSEPDR